MTVTFHSHSGEFCFHGSGTLEEIVQKAISQGVKVLGFSEHVPRYRPADLYPEESHLTPTDLTDQFNSYLLEAYRLRQKYASQIEILVGLETELITSLDLDKLEALLDTYKGKIEYIVGSVHHVSCVPIDLDPNTFSRALMAYSNSLPNLISSYLDTQRLMIERIQPEVIGHFDIFRLYYPAIDLQHYPSVWSKVVRNINLVISYGGLFEISTAPLRKGWSTPYPGPDIATAINELGGRFTISDDAHKPEHVAFGYDQIPAYLKRIGITKLYRLKSSSPRDSDEGCRQKTTVIPLDLPLT